jgi:outer membrane lipoprotein SlyB
MKFYYGITAVLLTVVMAGCTPKSMSGDVYSRERAQKVQTVEYGEVVEVRQVLIEGTKSGLGAVGGGALGGALGSGVGSGAGSTIAVVGGVIVGALAGGAAEEAATKTPGVEVTVRMDAGNTIALVQGVDPPVRAGDRVRILRNPDGSARAIPMAGEREQGAPPQPNR